MSNHGARWLYLLLGLVLTVGGQVPKAGKAGWTFAEMQRSVTKLRFRGQNGSATASDLEAISDALQTIRGRYVSQYHEDADTEEQLEKNLTADYSESMVENLRALQDKDASPKMLEFVYHDLAVKAQAIRKAQIISSEFPSVVDVALTVTTSSKPAPPTAGLSIRTNSCGRGVQQPGRVIGNGTGPFHTKFAPGCFVIWAQSGEQVIAHIDQDIGLSNDKPEKIQLIL